MIVCSCTEISDRDIERALLEILCAPDAPIPTPGIVYRHLAKRMNCCSCAPLAVETIYNKVDALEKKGLIERVGQAADRRKIAVHLTARGEAWYEKDERDDERSADDAGELRPRPGLFGHRRAR